MSRWPTTAERFHEKYCPEPNTGCWLWDRAATPGGYGHFSLEGRPESAHRASWRIYRGPIPTGLFVCHRCDTPSCVNPDHLFLGTGSDNIRDRHSKGRSAGPRGSRHGLSKLTDETVCEIRKRYARGGVLQRELGAEFGVNQAAISKVVLGQNWRTY